ncbi:MAG: hypothetical protein J5815_00195 [Clostridia bacterium]|nr:hypothetical protein [Clostridia bacterium]
MAQIISKRTSLSNKKHVDFAKLKQLVFSPKTIATILLVIFATLMIVNPKYYLDATRRGLSLYATTVLPSLFPFYFCAMLLTKIGAAKTLSLIFEKPMKKLYRTPKESAYIMLLSMLSGYPVGAACIKELYLASAISKEDAKAISSFASTSGPIFILGTLGTAIFQNATVGAIVLVSHYLAAFLNGFIYRNKKQTALAPVSIQAQDTDNVLAESVSKSTLAMLTLGGYIVLAGILVDTLFLLGVDKALTRVLGDNAQPIVAMIFGAVEMTRGTIECSKCAYLPLGAALASMIVSFGGLSVILQSHALLSPCGIKLSQIVLRKLTQSVISFVITFAIAFSFQRFL